MLHARPVKRPTKKVFNTQDIIREAFVVSCWAGGLWLLISAAIEGVK